MNKLKDFLYDISDLLLAGCVFILLCLSFYFTISQFFTDLFFQNPSDDSSTLENSYTMQENVDSFSPSTEKLDSVETTTSPSLLTEESSPTDSLENSQKTTNTMDEPSSPNPSPTQTPPLSK